jgi:predicted metal-dependent enzyme (double-stranded beta helix superfamily)
MNHDLHLTTDTHAAANAMRFSGALPLNAIESTTARFAEPVSELKALKRLCDSLDAAFEQSADAVDPSQRAAFASGVRAALAEAAADPALLLPAQREGAPNTYRRHLLAADPRGRYAIAALIWQPGQASPIHAHQTWCGYAVIDGTLSETVYSWSNEQQCASETRTHPREGGAVSFVRAGRGGIHRLGNTSDAVAISLHIYGVEGSQIATHVNDLLEVGQAAERTLA